MFCLLIRLVPVVYCKEDTRTTKHFRRCGFKGRNEYLGKGSLEHKQSNPFQRGTSCSSKLSGVRKGTEGKEGVTHTICDLTAP